MSTPTPLRLRVFVAVGLAVVVAISAASVGTAQAKAAGCGLKLPGAPVVHASSAITSTGVARCNTRWKAMATLQVEQDGSWATAFADGTPIPHQLDGPYAAHIDHRTDYSWGIIDPTPYCAYSFRVQVAYTTGDGSQIGVAFSPTTHATCRSRRT